MRYVMGTSRDREPSAQLTDQALAAEVTAKARCADGTLDPDEWFPVSTDAEAARREAAGALAICTACPVRGGCLELSLRHWTIGQHGVWGGLVARPGRVAPPMARLPARIWPRPVHPGSHLGRGPGNQSRRAKGPARHYGRHLAPRLVQHASSQDGPRAAQAPDSGGAPVVTRPHRAAAVSRPPPRSRRWGRHWPGRCPRWTPRMPRGEPMLGG